LAPIPQLVSLVGVMVIERNKGKRRKIWNVLISTLLLKETKYEIQNPKLVAQHRLVATFGSMFRVFHFAWSTCRATKTFIAVWRNAVRWLVDLVEHEQICCMTSCEFDEKRATKPKLVAQIRPALYLAFRNNFLQPVVPGQVDHARWKMRNVDPKFATKQCCARSCGFLKQAKRE